jgi:hypothetical protein
MNVPESRSGLGRPPPIQASHPLNGIQIFGIVMISLFLLFYLIFIVMMYKSSSQESKRKFKATLRKRVSLAPEVVEKDTLQSPRRVSLGGKERARSIVETMAVLGPEVTSALHENRVMEIELPSISPSRASTMEDINFEAGTSRKSDHEINDYNDRTLSRDQIKQIDMLLMLPDESLTPRSTSETSTSPPEENSPVSNISPAAILFAPVEGAMVEHHSISPDMDFSAKISQREQILRPTPVQQRSLFHCKSFNEVTQERFSRIASLDLSNQLLDRDSVTSIGSWPYFVRP